MRYITEQDANRNRVNRDKCGSIHKSGSVKGMQLRFGWKPKGQIRIGSYVYNVGPSEVERLRALGVVRGEA